VSSDFYNHMKPTIIVSGLGRTGYKIYSLLKRQRVDVVGISDRVLKIQHDEKIITGDSRSAKILIEAGIRQAKTLVLAHNDDSLNLAILTQARVMNPRIRIVNRLLNQTLGERLDVTLPDHFSMSVAALAAPIFTFAALGDRAIGQLRLFNRIWPIQEEVIDGDHPWLGKPLTELWENPNRMLIYYLPAKGEIDLVGAIMQKKCLQFGDRIIIGTQPKIQTKRNPLVRKLLKAVSNLPQYQHYARPVAIVSLSLILIIFLATVVYLSVNLNISIADALYFSVGMITGAGGKEEVAEYGSDLVKIFTAIMMIVGAGVIGICYALINDFILGSRLKQAWDVARVPTRNHYVVCGLGGIGIKIACQLHQQGHEVVAIELDSNSRFVNSARSKGIPVIIEDASLAFTLKAANVKRAKSLITVTGNDMANLEIALTAKAIAPYLKTIVRSYDPQFAQSMQEVFEFDRVLSPVELSTHSFAAAALGGRILGNGMTQDLLWVALATMITAKHPFCGKVVRHASTRSDFVPLYLERKGRTLHGWELLETYLAVEDVLYLTIPASGLEQLWRTSSSEELAFS
jgi:voltage-gated potassium channel Kch